MSVMAMLQQLIGATMPTMWRTAGYAAALVGLMIIAATAQNNNAAFAKFKHDMLSKVGQKITVVGIWSDRTKQCCWLAFDDWGAYVYAAKESGIARERKLFAHFRNGQTVKVTGTLRYLAEPSKAERDKYGGSVQIAPEHFFFDAAEVEMSVDHRPLKNP